MKILRNILIFILLYNITTICTAAFRANSDSASITIPVQSSITIDVLSNDLGDNLSIDRVTKPKNGNAWISGSAIMYQPDWGFLGKDSFKYYIKENGAGRSKRAAVNVTVNGPAEPVADDFSVSTNVREQVAVPVIGDNPDGVSIDWGYSLTPRDGSAWGSGSNIIYSPDWDFAGGSDSFRYRLKDIYGRTSTGRININVIAPEEPVAVEDNATTQEGVQVVIPVLDNDTPVGEISIDYGYSLRPGYGSAWWGNNSIIYQPKAGVNNITDSFQYRIKDSFNRTATGTVNVFIGLGEPVVNDDAVDFAITDSSNRTTSIDVLENDFPDGLKINKIVRNPSHGVAVISTDKTCIEYTADEGFTGVDSFKYNVKDSLDRISTRAKVTVNVSIKPKANSNRVTLPAEDSSIDINVLENDTPAGDIEINSTVSGPQKGSVNISSDRQSIVYTPDSSFTEGTDSFTYTINLISDPTSVSQPATVTITSESSTAIEANNDSAVITENTANVVINVLDNDTPVGDIEINAVSDPVKGSVNIINNTILYTPDSSFTDGTDSFTYTINLISDPSSLSEPATVTVTMDNGSVGEGEITPAIINATDENAISDLTESGSLIELDESNATDTSILPAIYLLNYKHIYNAYSEYDPGNEDLSKISDLCDELYQKRLEIEEGDMEDTAAVLEDFNTKMGTLVNSLQSLEDIE